VRGVVGGRGEQQEEALAFVERVHDLLGEVLAATNLAGSEPRFVTEGAEAVGYLGGEGVVGGGVGDEETHEEQLKPYGDCRFSESNTHSRVW
jgi:hypothetical protein